MSEPRPNDILVDSPGDPADDPHALCERERLERIGAIQPFGALLGGAPGDERVTLASAGAARWLGLSAPGGGADADAPLLGRPLSGLLDIALSDFPTQPGHKRILPGLLAGPGGLVDGVLANGESGWLLEIEPAASDERAPPVADPALRRLFQIPPGEAGFGDYALSLADAVRRVTGFHRTMVYRFLPDGCGEVVAESAAAGPPRYLGLRFPPGDVPQIARALYSKNSHRQIPDVDAQPEPVAVLPGCDGDLTYSDLRAVSPVHREYLTHMGVRASLSFPIPIANHLWGLVACHHPEPRFLPLPVREHCVELAHTFALGVASYQANRRLQRLSNADAWVERLAELSREVEQGVSPRERLEEAVLAPLAASGAALVGPDRIHTFGNPPAPAELAAIDAWARQAAGGEPVLASDRLAAESGLALDMDRAAGLLMVQSAARGALQDLSAGGRRFYWFRPEEPRVVRWAGEPEAPRVTESGPTGANGDGGEGAVRYSPRRSFDLWVETKRGLSAPWDEMDLLVARKLRILVMRSGVGGNPWG